MASASRVILPLSILPPKLCLGLAPLFRGIGIIYPAAFPSLPRDLVAAQYETDAVSYTSACFAAAFSNTLLSFALVSAFGSLYRRPFGQAAPLAFAIALVIGMATFATCMVYPRIVGSRLQREVDSNLIQATRQLLIQVRSGVPLFNSIMSVSTGYGSASKEFEKVVKRLNAGIPEADALADASASSPSHKFRKVAWQVSNALKVGSDMGLALQTTLAELELEQVENIRKYAAELSPLTMIYMISAIVFPSLGITMLIVVGSLLSFPIPKVVLPVIFIALVGFQFMFFNFVSTRRPAV